MIVAEEMTMIDKNLPGDREHYLNVLLFCVAASRGWHPTSRVSNEQEKVEVISNITELVETTDQYKKYKTIFDHIQESNTVPEAVELPAFLTEAKGSDGFESLVRSLLGFSNTPHLMGILQVAKIKLTRLSQFFFLMDRFHMSILALHPTKDQVIEEKIK